MSTPTICAICAWRETCQKKFSMSGKDLNCPDFSKDLSIKNEPENEKDNEKMLSIVNAYQKVYNLTLISSKGGG